MNLKDKKLAIYELIKLIIFILFVGHFIGCSYILLVALTPEETNNWLSHADLQDENTEW